ncbi:MAG: DNA polymerase III subunit alpha [Chitinispirillales bacterium]|jgi:DNA polymerase-3 subunit alpha|nr:DNA polymerase III subunit alpha [Chitinispirillales bacterium]
MSVKFVSLHNHTEYSFLDGAIKIKDLVRKAKEFEMPALAITDHGGLFGAVEFYETCIKEDIKPVLGFEAYVAPGSRTDRSSQKDERNYSHLILLAQNDTGWKNLMRLSTIGYTEGFYYKPRIDMEVLRKYGEGIIAASACVAGAIPQAIIRNELDKARKLTEDYIAVFGEGNFYFELQDHGIDEERIASKGLISLGREMGVPFIVANDAHYLRREDAPSHEVLLCIQTQTTMDDPKRYKFSTDQVYFKSPVEMARLFPDIPEAVTNTVDIAERCNVNVKIKPQLPSAGVPSGFTKEEDYLSGLSKKGLVEKYAKVTPALEERLEYELGVINNMGFAGYFLIVRDIIDAANKMGIMVGCRGSVAGSLVAYVTSITNVDPIKYDLIFERFLNPERISMPDADIDFADRDRYKVIDYVNDKYGKDSVCQIINFGTMKAKMVVKDVARTMGISVGEANRLSSMVNEKNLEKSYNANPELVKTKESSAQYGELFRHAEVLEGLTRQPGMHAAGVIIAPGEVVGWAPLYKQSNSEVLMTQYDMNYVEKVGLVKMDFLGLRTLTVLQESLRLVKKYHGSTVDVWNLPENDEKTYSLFGKGETTGVFQFESPGMQEYLRKLKPTCVEDLIAMVALYRPGPMDNIDSFINRKHGKEKVRYLHSSLESILGVTYGVIIYQEQVMRIAQVMGGFTLGLADVLRKAMGKKQEDVMAEMGVKFVEGAKAKGIDKKTAQDVYDLMAKFAAYGFNKAHAAVYAHVSYQTAYFKAHYPLEYMTAYLGAYLGDMDEFLRIRNEAEKMGIRMLPPDVNKSEYDFSIDSGSIRIGLGAIKNVGKAGDLILSARQEKGGPFTSIFDLCKSTDTRIVNKKALESLICAGALDGFGVTRAQNFEAVAAALDYGNSCRQERDSGQVNLFDIFDSGDNSAPTVAVPEPQLPDVSPWSVNKQLQNEKEILGFYTSGHPLDQFFDEIRGFSDADIASEAFKNIKDGAQITIGGLVTSAKPRVIQGGRNAGKQMCILELESFDASIKLVAYSEAYEKFKEMFVNDAMLLVRGKVKKEEEAKAELNVENCMLLSETREKLTRSVHVRVPSERLQQKFIDDIYDICASNSGKCALVIHLSTISRNQYCIKANNVNVASGTESLSKLRELLGKENVWIAKTAP